MPVLPIPSDDVWPHMRDVIVVWAHMCFPADEQSRSLMMRSANKTAITAAISLGINPLTLVADAKDDQEAGA